MGNKCLVCRDVVAEEDNATHLIEMELGTKDFAEETVCKKCAVNHIVGALQVQFKPAFEKMYRLINNMSFDHQGYTSDAMVNLFFNEHRQLQADFLNFIAKVLKKIGSRSGDTRWEDPRNQWALAFAKRAADAIYPPS